MKRMRWWWRCFVHRQLPVKRRGWRMDSVQGEGMRLVRGGGGGGEEGVSFQHSIICWLQQCRSTGTECYGKGGLKYTFHLAGWAASLPAWAADGRLSRGLAARLGNAATAPRAEREREREAPPAELSRRTHDLGSSVIFLHKQQQLAPKSGARLDRGWQWNIGRDQERAAPLTFFASTLFINRMTSFSMCIPF